MPKIVKPYRPTMAYGGEIMNCDKLASTVLYLLRGCSAKLGLTSLLKMIYFADYRHFQEHLSPISGARYVAMERGPVVEDYRKVIEDLERQGLVRTADVPMAGHPGHPKREFVALAEPNEDLFSETEIKVLDDLSKHPVPYLHASDYH